MEWLIGKLFRFLWKFITAYGELDFFVATPVLSRENGPFYDLIIYILHQPHFKKSHSLEPRCDTNNTYLHDSKWSIQSFANASHYISNKSLDIHVGPLPQFCEKEKTMVWNLFI